MIKLAIWAQEKIPAEEREISCHTLNISENLFKQFKRRIKDFENEMYLEAVKEDFSDRIYQFNFQFFPLIKKDGE